MSYRLLLTESPAVGIRRIAREELRLAAAALGHRTRETARVHAARKHLKKLRALLRLARGRTGPEFFRTHNRRLRDLARRLSPMRDAHVTLTTLRQLQRRAAGTTTRRALARLRKLVAARALRDADENTMRGIAAQLTRLRLEVQTWPFEKMEWSHLQEATCVGYRRGKVEFEYFRLNRQLTSLHEWRKQAKALWYQLLVLEPFCKKSLRRSTKQLDHLAEVQGKMHDLHVVLSAVMRHTRPLAVWEREAILDLVGEQLDTHATEVLRLGEEIFRPSPAALARKFHRHPH